MLTQIVHYFQQHLSIAIYFDMVPERTDPPFAVLELGDIIPEFSSGSTYHEDATVFIHLFTSSMSDLETYNTQIQNAFDLEHANISADCEGSIRTKTKMNVESGNVYHAVHEYQMRFARSK